MQFEPHAGAGGVVLAEGSVFERLRRDPRIGFDTDIAHAGLVFDEKARATLAAVHRSYLDIGRELRLPMLVLADTWRASGERVRRSRFAGLDVVGQNVRFVRELIGDLDALAAALIGPAGDAYDAREALAPGAAMRYHEPQVARLAAAAPDLVVAATLPALGEARGLASALAAARLPYVISFVARPDGTLLDGNRLADAIAAIDDAASIPPIGFGVNCVHSTVADAALSTLSPAAASRIVLFQGNTSRLSPEELDGRSEIDSEAPEAFAAGAADTARRRGITIVGGCCGSDERHIEALGRLLKGDAGS
jgi:homocysteine S-methyltransferase